ncbi:alkaline phosphatase D family protein [Qipengyuania qiaonensis]|uniref:Alkaline phosphatase D family protein n=1 Tax=Qipengyuania qiaonensis TaxID=2867240 RepID=A0ABS7J9V9_9SPHN|nr:alkaline phosphatase D family protein [Qipengyuania qiaonensis]MBX7481767.1 alkaline phosphatase D family protein [Qipengyuania qiaonensis]
MIATEPPAAARTPALDRRTLLKGGLLGLGAAGAPLAAQDPAAGFTHGVASGEPGSGRVLVWTRYVGNGDTSLEFELSESPDFARAASGGQVTASADNDWCCKAWAEGLQPGHWYYFRFTAPDGSQSDVGRTKTLPDGPTEKFRMAVFSCSNLGFGWFNAYAHAAVDGNFDCALHLGDYFYEYGPGTYPSSDEAQPGRTLFPASEVVSLADYRLRYATYRRDPDLRRLHQLYPMIAGWDDHESANDSWKDGAQNHQPETEGEWSVRKATAVKAYREWMPVSDEPWAAYEVGNLATLFRLETRLTARAEQFSYGSILAGKTSPDDAMAALIAFREGAYRDPGREMLGMQQQAWLADGLKRSAGAGKPWQVLVQQVLMGNLATAPVLAEGLPADLPDYVRQRILAGTMAGRAELPLNMDAWDGYPAARDRLFESALEADANIVSLAGDTHNAWAFDLDRAGAKVGVEFGVQGVTSPGLESYASYLPTSDLERATIAHNRQLKWMDGSRRGYMAVELTPGSASCEFRFLSSVREKGAGVTATKRVTTLAGSRMLDVG